jgi:hypothetical protein
MGCLHEVHTGRTYVTDVECLIVRILYLTDFDKTWFPDSIATDRFAFYSQSVLTWVGSVLLGGSGEGDHAI